MFDGCASLTSLDLSSFNTGAVENMSMMFYECTSLVSLDLSSFNTERVNNVDSIFDGCTSLISLDLSNFDTKLIEDMSYMFNDCSSLTSLDLSSFDTKLVVDMRHMFYNCSSLTSLDLSNFDTGRVNNMNNMFDDSKSLQTLKLGPNFVIGNSINKSGMFLGCSKLYKIIIGKNRTDFADQLIQILKNSGLDKGWEYNSVEGYISIDPYTISTSIHLFYPDWYEYNEQAGTATIYIDEIISTGTLRDCSNSFKDKTALKQITNITSLDTRYVTTMSGMFSGCTNLGLPLD